MTGDLPTHVRSRFSIWTLRLIAIEYLPMRDAPTGQWWRNSGVACFVLAAVLWIVASSVAEAALPRRLVILLDGVAYRDVVALQKGIPDESHDGGTEVHRAFHEGWFPASRLISTFPSASDVSWTEILGNPPLPGYQRTYYHRALGKEVYQNGVTSTMEFELQMHWQLQSGFRRAIGYVHPQTIFQSEVREMIEAFLATDGRLETFYGMLRASDDAQHTRGDILKLLLYLDRELDALRKQYRASEERELEILIVSDHGNNHAGAGTRSPVRSFLSDAGYRLSKAIRTTNDVVLPTVGIQNWIEIHCMDSEVERLAERLTKLEGADVVTSVVPGQKNVFHIRDTANHRAVVQWNPESDSYRMDLAGGDPVGYAAVLDAMRLSGAFDVNGFATARDWEAATMSLRYPLAPERIARAHTRLALNSAPILIGLSNGWIHCAWMLEKLSTPMKMGGTHGGLDAECSTGILLSSFAPTRDSASPRVAVQFEGFPGRRCPREGSSGAQWIATSPDGTAPPSLRIWSASLADAPATVRIEVEWEVAQRYPTAVIRRADARTIAESTRSTLSATHAGTESADYERVAELPPGTRFTPGSLYRIRGTLPGTRENIFEMEFETDSNGLPAIQ